MFTSILDEILKALQPEETVLVTMEEPVPVEKDVQVPAVVAGPQTEESDQAAEKEDVPHDRKLVTDLKRLVIYSEIMRPKFDERIL